MNWNSYERRHETITTHAWETWTRNGLNLDDDSRRETAKSASDAATNAYVDGISDQSWLAATLAILDPAKTGEPK